MGNPNRTTPQRVWLIRGAAAIGAVVVIPLVVAITLGAPPQDVVSLEGTWEGQLIGEPGRFEVPVPGLWGTGASPPRGPIRVERFLDLEASSVPRAILIETPRYAARALLDGVEIGRVGDPTGTERSAQPLVAPLPVHIEGRHLLAVEIGPALGQVGITGRVLLGPTDRIVAVAVQTERLRLVTALALCLLAVTQLAVAARGHPRRSFLYFGLLLLAIGMYALGLSALASSWMGVDAANRLRRVTVFVSPALGLAHAMWSLRERLPRLLVAYGAFTAGAALSAALVPESWLYRLEVIGDINLLGGALAYFGILAVASWQRVPWAAAQLVGAGVPLIAGVVVEMVVTHGILPAGSYLFFLLATFFIGNALILELSNAEESERQRRLFAGSADGMVVVDRVGRVVQANPVTAVWLGSPVAGNLVDRVEPDDRERVRRHLERGQGAVDRVEYTVGTARIRVESVVSPVGDGLVLVVLRDVTARRRADAVLLDAARMETVAKLVGGVAHEYNNILGALMAQAGVLRVFGGSESMQARYEKIERTIDRAAQLTRRFRALSTGTGSRDSEVDFAEVCRSAAELVEPTLTGEVRLQLDIVEPMPTIRCAGPDIEHVLVNLMFNARDAQKGRGRIWLRARPWEDRGVALAVDDDGPGIGDADKDRVFHPFFTTKATGTGLGLALAAQILREHQGRIWVEDRPGGGARILAVLPTGDEDPLADLPLPEGRLILVVDTDPAFRLDHRTWLGEAGFDVHDEDSVAGALNWLEGHRPDLVLMSALIDDAAAFDLARAASARYPGTPVVLLAGLMPSDEISLENPDWRLLPRPMRPARLVGLVKAARLEVERGAPATGAARADLSRITAASLGF